MINKETIKQSFINAIGTLVYVSLVALLMNNGEKIFGKAQDYIAPVAILLLFVISAAVTGTLVLGKPVLLFAKGERSEALRLFFATLGWLVLFLVIIFGYLAIR